MAMFWALLLSISLIFSTVVVPNLRPVDTGAWPLSGLNIARRCSKSSTVATWAKRLLVSVPPSISPQTVPGSLDSGRGFQWSLRPSGRAGAEVPRAPALRGAPAAFFGGGPPGLPGGAPLLGGTPLLGGAPFPGGAPLPGGTPLPGGAPLLGGAPFPGGTLLPGGAVFPGGATFPGTLPAPSVPSPSDLASPSPPLPVSACFGGAEPPGPRAGPPPGPLSALDPLLPRRWPL
mmetsp:Transcript_33261/g.86243  ORF Transcript_33261/g.86243 Transcript_33261/m.86243 type:complete len:232 (-) Transcript_33261:171-866(-)